MSNVILEFYKKNDVKPSYSLTVNVNGLSRAEFTNLIYEIAGDFCKISRCDAWSVRAMKDVITELKENG
jgi:hypothetical protein